MPVENVAKPSHCRVLNLSQGLNAPTVVTVFCIR